ncbi:MAG: tetratricopeptide repeat protein [Elusimicrobiota bacterium]|nr:tetratricopeptide repeat protein [Elusimicrobiota bacterium]
MPIGFTQDDAHYINAARWLAGTQTIQKSLDAYPLGYSLILVPAAKLFPESLNVFKIFNIFLFLMIIPVLFGIFKDYLTKEELLFFLLLSSLNPLMVEHSSLVIPAGAFLLVSLAAFYLIQKASLKDTPPYAALASAAFLTAYLCAIRFEGFLFATAVILGLILAKRIRHALYFTFFYVVLVATYIHFSAAFTVTGGRFFGYMFDGIHGGGIYDILRKTSVFYFIEFTYSIFLTAFIGEKLGGFALIPAIFVFAVFVRGFLGKKKFEGEIILKIYFVLYVLLHLTWPTRYTKFFLALLPFIIFYFMAGAKKFGRRTARVFFAGLFVFFLYNGIKTGGRRIAIQAPETMAFIRASVPPDAVFTSSFASQIFLYTNRKSAYPNKVRKDDDMFYSLVKTGADYVYVNMLNEKSYLSIRYGKSPQEKIIQCMDNSAMYFPVYKNEKEQTAIWRVKPGLKEDFMTASAYVMKASEFFKAGDSRRAKKAYRRALNIFTYPPAVNNCAVIYMEDGELDEAEKILIDGIALFPRSAMLHALYGRLCKMKGEYKKSAEFYKKALEFAADFDDAGTQNLAASELSVLEGIQNEK